MIITGLKITVLGMAVVACFLLLLILIVNISFRFLASESARELAEIEAAELRRQQRKSPADDNVLVSVIAAAVAAYRRRRE